MSDYYATGTVSVDNLDSPDEAAEVAILIESALRSAGYHATASLTAVPWPVAGAGESL